MENSSNTRVFFSFRNVILLKVVSRLVLSLEEDLLNHFVVVVVVALDVFLTE